MNLMKSVKIHFRTSLNYFKFRANLESNLVIDLQFLSGNPENPLILRLYAVKSTVHLFKNVQNRQGYSCIINFALIVTIRLTFISILFLQVNLMAFNK